MSLNSRAAVVARYKSAFQHPSEGALKEYLKEHPHADPSKHTVKPEGEGKSKAEEGGKGPDKKPEKSKGLGEKTKGFFKGLSDKAKNFVSKSSEEVQKFVSDPKHRKDVLKDAGKSIMASPKTYAKRLVSTAKHEIHEFKEAGEAIAHLAKGKKLEPAQKKVLKTVAIHMGVAVAAAALTSTGVLAGAAALGKGMATKIAMKAAMRALENVHLLQEIQHIGHGVMHLLASEDKEKGEKLSPEEAFAMLVMQSVQKELEELDDDTVSEAVEEASGAQEKEAARLGHNFEGALQTAVASLVAMGGIVSNFDRVLLAARTKAASDGLPKNRVWQDRFVAMMQALEPSLTELQNVEAALDTCPGKYASLAQEARTALQMPRQAAIEYAISDVDFFSAAGMARDGITYDVPRLREWGSNLSKWASTSQGTVRNVLSKAKALV